MTTCTIIRFNNGIQLLSCTLGTDFEIFCKIYYLLYGSEFFSDYLFLLVVTVVLQQLRNSLIIALKLTLIFLIETASAKQSGIYTVAEWTKQVLLGFVYHAQIK